MADLNRRDLLRSGALAAGALTLGPAFVRDALAAPARAGASPYGALLPPDVNGVMMPPGFHSRIIARGLLPMPGTGYSLPMFPDGQATFRTGDGGWVLTTNHETLAALGGGVTATRFAPDGTIRGAKRILGGTDVNCAGGPTPWGTWLSCEETDTGLVWESDPAGRLRALARPALGAFTHEAVAVDPVDGHLFLSEDESNGCLYRFVPARYPNLSVGRLQVARIGAGGKVQWLGVPDPSANTIPTREQVRGATRFRGGEGLWYAEGIVYFTTKGDKRVWAYDTRSERIEILFDRATAPDSSLNAVDNVTVSSAGDVLVCEDGGNLEIGIITPDRRVAPLVRLPGTAHTGSELCGVVFDPSGSRLYFTSQRGQSLVPLRNAAGLGVVFEVSGPFRPGPGGRSLAPVFGPPAGEVRPNGPLNPGGDGAPPGLRVKVGKRVSRGALTGSGLLLRVAVDEPSRVTVTFSTPDLAKPRRREGIRRPVQTRLARATVRIEGDGSVRVRLKPAKRIRAKLAKRNKSLRGRLTVQARDGAGNVRVVTRTLTIGARRRSARRSARRVGR
jgi:hypothetical protein